MYGRALAILLGFIGLMSGIQGLANENVVVALNAVFPIAMCSFIVGGVAAIVLQVAISDDSPDAEEQRFYIAAGLGVVGGLVWFFALNGPVEESDREFGFLSVLGIAVIVLGIVLVASVLHDESAERVKTCPDCAKQVPKDARICHFCRYDFDQQRAHGRAVQP